MGKVGKKEQNESEGGIKYEVEGSDGFDGF